MNSMIKSVAVLALATAIILVGITGAVAGSQSNGNSIYEDGIDKLISLDNSTSDIVLVARSQSNGNSIYEDNLGKLVG